MSLKFKPRDPKPVEDLRKKIQSAEISNFKKSLMKHSRLLGKNLRRFEKILFLNSLIP